MEKFRTAVKMFVHLRHVCTSDMYCVLFIFFYVCYLFPYVFHTYERVNLKMWANGVPQHRPA